MLTAILACLVSQIPPVAPPAEWQSCGRAIEWLHAAEVPDTEVKLPELVANHAIASYSAEWIRDAIAKAPSIDDCLKTAKERGKLLLWYVPHVEGQHMILPHLLDRYMTVGPLSDPDVASLVNRRFVALKLPGGGALADRFELKAPQFIEPGLLVFAPDGRLLWRANRISTFDADWLLAVLSALVKQSGAAPSASSARAKAAWDANRGDADRALAVADEALADGDAAAARAAVDSVAGKASGESLARALALRGRIERRERRGAAALDVLATALAATKDPALSASIRCDLGRVRLAQGEFAAAETLLAKARADAPSSPRAAECGYHQGVAQYFQRREADAVKTWTETAAAQPDSIWAAKSAGCAKRGSDGAQGEGPLTRSMLDPRWMAPEVYEPRPDTQWRRKPADAADVARRGIEFLLMEQRSSGRWEGPRWGGNTDATDDGAIDNIDMAITALCCAALWQWRDRSPEAIRAAVGRGETYLRDERGVHRGEAMGWVYADAFRLMHFARRLPAMDESGRKSTLAAMQEWADALIAQQQSNGGAFRHFVYSGSFVTATVTYCLLEAKHAGVRVPDAAIESAASVLEKTRDADSKLFGYLVDRPEVARSRAGAAGRQPLSEWALFVAGKGSAERLDAALGVFFDEYRTSIELARKSNFHNPSLDYTAGYYFFHDFYPACEAARASGPNAKKNVERLLALLCELPEIDGTFVDSGFSYGKSYATAMALLSLSRLVDDGKK